MLRSVERDEYSPSFVVESTAMATLASSMDGPPNQCVSKEENLRVGAFEFKLGLARSSFIGWNYEFSLKCQTDNIDPHWSIKFEVAYTVNLREAEKEFSGTKTFEANDNERFFKLGPFEADADTLTDMQVALQIKMLEWKAIHSPLQFDFGRRSALSDATLVVEEERLGEKERRKIYVTKAILAMQSGYFQRLFEEDASDSEFKILNVEYDDLILFLTLIYPHTTSKEVPDLLSRGNLDNLLELAGRFECPSITGMVEVHLIGEPWQTQEPNCLLLSDKHSLSHLCTQQLKQISFRDRYKVMKQREDYLKLSDELRSHLLESVVDKMGASAAPPPFKKPRRDTPIPSRSQPAGASTSGMASSSSSSSNFFNQPTQAASSSTQNPSSHSSFPPPSSSTYPFFPSGTTSHPFTSGAIPMPPPPGPSNPPGTSSSFTNPLPGFLNFAPSSSGIGSHRIPSQAIPMPPPPGPSNPPGIPSSSTLFPPLYAYLNSIPPSSGTASHRISSRAIPMPAPPGLFNAPGPSSSSSNPAPASRLLYNPMNGRMTLNPSSSASVPAPSSSTGATVASYAASKPSTSGNKVPKLEEPDS